MKTVTNKGYVPNRLILRYIFVGQDMPPLVKMQLYIILTASLFLILVLLSQPTLNAFFRAKRAGFSINLSESFDLRFAKTQDIYDALKIAVENHIPTSGLELAAHKNAGGNVVDCVEAYLYALHNDVVVNFQQILTVDLARKDLMECISLAMQNLKITVNRRTQNISSGKVYQMQFIGEFRINFSIIWFAPPNIDTIKNEIYSSVSDFFTSFYGDNLLEAEKIVNEKILDSKFWESKGLILINQNISIQ